MDAQLIRKAREIAGESQTAFGQRFGVDQGTVSRWETDGPPTRGAGRVMLSREVEAILAAHKAKDATEGGS